MFLKEKMMEKIISVDGFEEDVYGVGRRGDGKGGGGKGKGVV